MLENCLGLFESVDTYAQTPGHANSAIKCGALKRLRHKLFRSTLTLKLLGIEIPPSNVVVFKTALIDLDTGVQLEDEANNGLRKRTNRPMRNQVVVAISCRDTDTLRK